MIYLISKSEGLHWQHGKQKEQSDEEKKKERHRQKSKESLVIDEMGEIIRCGKKWLGYRCMLKVKVNKMVGGMKGELRESQK